MAALDFPNSPSVNDTYSAGGRTWTWDGTTWLGSWTGLAALLASYLPLTGGTMAGDITMDNNDIFGVKQLTNYQIVDDGTLSASTKTIDFTTGLLHKAEMANAAITFTFTPPSAPAVCQLQLAQDGTGARTMILPSGTWPGTYSPADRLLSVGPSLVDLLVARWDGAAWYYTLAKNWKV